jgi:hypothetical protein
MRGGTIGAMVKVWVAIRLREGRERVGQLMAEAKGINPEITPTTAVHTSRPGAWRLSEATTASAAASVGLTGSSARRRRIVSASSPVTWCVGRARPRRVDPSVRSIMAGFCVTGPAFVYVLTATFVGG